MIYELALAQDAEDEIQAVYRWIARRAPLTAELWQERLLKAIGSLDLNPQRCPLAPETDVVGFEVRQLLFGKRSGTYRILFSIEHDHVLIRHVVLASRPLLRPPDF